MSSSPVIFHYHTKKEQSQNNCDINDNVKAALHAGILPKGSTPTDKDILCGRGNAFANHPGNKNFSIVVRDNLQRYVDAPKRMEKSMVVASVVAEIVNSGTRFVKQEKSSGRWYQMNQDQMHEKTGHAIRDLIKSSKTPIVPSKSAETTKTTSKRRRRSSSSSKNSAVSKSSQAKKMRRSSRRSVMSLEPINCLSEAFCHSTFETNVSRNFSLTTSDILNKVLEAQQAIVDENGEEEEQDLVTSPPELKPVVTDDTFPEAVPSAAAEDVAMDLDAQEILTGDWLEEEDDDLIDIVSVNHNHHHQETTEDDDIIPHPVESADCIPTEICVATPADDEEETPDVSANDFARVYELLSSDDESSVEGGAHAEQDKNEPAEPSFHSMARCSNNLHRTVSC